MGGGRRPCRVGGMLDDGAMLAAREPIDGEETRTSVMKEDDEPATEADHVERRMSNRRACLALGKLGQEHEMGEGIKAIFLSA